MKAHFPRVAAGFSVGFALGGLAAAALVSPLGGPEHLLALDAVAAAGMLALVVVTAGRFPDELRVAPPRPVRGARATRTSTATRQTWWSLLGNRMVALILGYQLLSAAVTQLLDFMVWERAAARYPDPSSLAQFQGLFGAIINVVSVLFVVVLAGWLLTRFGVGFGLAANPVGVLVLLLVTTVAGYAVGSAALVFFVLVCAQQVTDIALTDGTTRASINATYQALRPDERLRAQTMVEGAGVPLALGFVGLLLIGFDVLGLGVRAVVAVTVGLTAVWLVASVLAFREYGANLRDVISKRAWDPVALRIDDDASRAAVGQLLASPDPHAVHAALDALGDSGHDVTPHVLGLMSDPDPARRALGLEVAVETGRLHGPTVVARVAELLDDSDPDVARRSAAALVRVDSDHREAGRSAWLGAVGSADTTVVGGAVAAATRFPHPFFVPYLIGLASDESVSADVLDALAAHCDHLAPDARRILADPSVPRRTRERVVHSLGLAGTPEARDLLVEHLDDGDPAVVEAASRCLVASGHTTTPNGLDLTPKLTALAARAHRSLQVLLLLEDHPDHEPLRTALRDEVTAAGRRAEVLLELVHDPRAIGSAVHDLSSSERARSTALEMLEVTCGRRVARLALALVDPALDDAGRLRMLGGHLPAPRRTLGDWLRELVADDTAYWRDPWLRACALYAVPGEFSADSAVGLVAPLVVDPDRDVAETARWVTGQWDGATPRRPPRPRPTASPRARRTGSAPPESAG
jgi:HEAT repeat protein